MNNKVSIIIPVFNVENYILRCLDSCINQTYRNIEIICVNDCSTDESENEIIRMLNADNRIKLLKNSENSGVFFSKDKGAKCADGDFLFFLDGDDYLPTNSIENLLENLNDTVDIISGNMEFVSEKTFESINTLSWSIFGNLNNNDFLKMIIELNHWSQCGMLIRKSIYDKIKYLPFSVKIREDALIMMQLCNCVHKIVCIDETVYFYVQRQSSALHRQKNNDERAIEDFTYASEASKIIKELPNISKENEYLIRSELIKELSWTLKSKIVLKENQSFISNLIRGHLRTKGMFKFILKENGVKSLLMYIASYFYPRFWILARLFN